MCDFYYLNLKVGTSLEWVPNYLGGKIHYNYKKNIYDDVN